MTPRTMRLLHRIGPTPVVAAPVRSIDMGVLAGRLTLTSLTPVTTADVIGGATLYLTPFNGNTVLVYDGSAFQQRTFAELSRALSGLVNGSIYDAFAYWDGAATQFDLGPAWTSQSARGSGAGTTQLALTLGIETNAVAVTGLIGGATIPAGKGTYLGTIRTTGTGTTEDSVLRRRLWNSYNQYQRKLSVTDNTSGWTYASTAWRQARANVANQVDCVLGLSGAPVDLICMCLLDAGREPSTPNAATFGQVGIGRDWTSGNGNEDTSTTGAYVNIVAVSVQISGASQAVLRDLPPIGSHTYVWIEAAGVDSRVEGFNSSPVGPPSNGIAGLNGYTWG